MSTKRKYDSTLRLERAADTRLRIQRSAKKLLIENGFEGTTIAAIASDAEVSPQTIYSTFGSKAAIVAAMMTHLEDEAGETETVEALMAEPDPRGQLRIFTQWIARLFDLSSDLFVITQKSPDAPGLSQMKSQGDSRRLMGCTRLTEIWKDAGALRNDIDFESAAEQLWLLSSVESFLNCTEGLGWSAEQFENWLYWSAERLLFTD
ncbi:TetR/AcrR family transcriptional regulator [Candidatus Lucifugimonas marina]|jgi:AcrR family transcriptional regulator|uniref:TetR family transcriptional regulator n=1 Tax=Candidatus Lucifugimonas marina TaxID=3038979 RepID=A0AAJ5ZKX5_9CHLR|nr:TetR family transcriptional regulator [SAR202 cluster bacterium JH702]MDG0869254.1 TetR family transcriptional regulator [SAR202 cluster bacterium JH639]WFG36657.1 TetR family transcriptional regulator [SAR202 cluster bacterium JH545]WFG40591.1 TetR family transcriptional regulator [SAR202 cluster bacterium JH1073]